MSNSGIKKVVTAEYKFTDEEMAQMRDDIADKIHQQTQKIDHKKSVAAQYKNEIDELSTQIKSLAHKISSRTEFREYTCFVEYDYEKKVKHFYEENSKELLKTEAITAYDWQLKMDLDKQAEEDAEIDADDQEEEEVEEIVGEIVNEDTEGDTDGESTEDEFTAGEEASKVLQLTAGPDEEKASKRRRKPVTAEAAEAEDRGFPFTP